MNLGEFHLRISAALRRGTSLDAQIPLWVAESANLIETMHTWSWMKKSGTIVTDPEDEFPGRLDLPNSRIKSIEFIKWQKPDPQMPDVIGYYDLVGVSPDLIQGRSNLNPTGYWLDGLNFIWLDTDPTEALTLWLRYAEYTDWPTDTAATPSLLLRGMSLLAAETLLLASQENRDPRLTDIYKARRDQAFMALSLAEQEIEFRHQSGMKMQYAPR